MLATVLGHWDPMDPTITDFALQFGIYASTQTEKQYVENVLQQRETQDTLGKQKRLERGK